MPPYSLRVKAKVLMVSHRPYVICTPLCPPAPALAPLFLEHTRHIQAFALALHSFWIFSHLLVLVQVTFLSWTVGDLMTLLTCASCVTPSS